MLTAKLSPYYFTYLLHDLQFKREQDLLQTIRLFIRAYETADVIGFRQQLNKTSFESCELEIVVFILCTFEQNGSFTRNLTSWSVPFWLVLLTEHKILHCYAPLRGCRTKYQFCGFSLADCRTRWFQVSNRSLEIHATAFVHHPYCFDRDFLIRIPYSCEIFMILIFTVGPTNI